MKFDKLHKIALFLVVAVFAVFVFSAATPHQHVGQENNSVHTCLACRAHSTVPLIEPSISVSPIARLVMKSIAVVTNPCLWEVFHTLSAPRAPPILS